MIETLEDPYLVEKPVVARPIVHSLSWLRGIAALMVCIFHVKKYIWTSTTPDVFTLAFEQGFLGVYVFFIVSGFVIPFSMYHNNYRIQRFFPFLLKRLVRIQPPFIIILLLLFAWTYGLNYFKGWGVQYLFDVKTFFLNITYLVPFLNGKWVVIIFWTLAIEFQFYILTALIYPLLMKSMEWRYSAFAIGVLVGHLVPEKYLTIFNNYIYFIIGFQLFLYHIGKIKRNELIISLILSIAYTWFFEFPAGAITAITTITLIYALNISSRIADFFGDISYSLYLSHGLACGATAIFTIGMNSWLRFGLCMIIGIAFATIYYYSIERIFLRLSKKVKY